jgi:hypothetical protein
MCGTGCASPEVCSTGACGNHCASGLTDCNRSCVDADSDSRNCGMCANACGQGEKCQGGTCVPECPVGQTLCSGNCAATNSDAKNCGACGNVCPDNFFCVFGVCILGCPPPLTRCIPDGGASDGGSQCVDTRSDPNNCGGCGGEVTVSPAPSMPHVCAVEPDRHTPAVCDDGRCAATCESGFFDCRSSGLGGESLPAPEPRGGGAPPTPSELMCFDFKNDPCACGGCMIYAPGHFAQFDVTTGASTICVDFGMQNGGASTGACCNSIPTQLDSDASCGTTCINVGPCPSSSPSCCVSGAGHACTDEATDIHNCGSCGHDCDVLCGPGGSCIAGCGCSCECS